MSGLVTSVIGNNGMMQENHDSDDDRVVNNVAVRSFSEH